jgi:uncharacterized FlaG/YvyC family protein
MTTDISAVTPGTHVPPAGTTEEPARMHRATIDQAVAKPKDPVTAPKDAAAAPPPESRMKEIVKELNDAVGALNSRLSFSLDNDTKKIVVKVVDSQTGETVRQIPPEDALKLSQRMSELVGVLLDKSE